MTGEQLAEVIKATIHDHDESCFQWSERSQKEELVCEKPEGVNVLTIANAALAALARERDAHVAALEEELRRADGFHMLWKAKAQDLEALVGRLEKVVEAARAYITVIGPDDAELDVLVDALADLDATR